MRKRKDRRRSRATAELPFDDLRQIAAERRRKPDRRLENLSAEQRQLLLSEMPGRSASKPGRKD